MLAGQIIGACANNAKNKSRPIITTAPIHVDGGEMEMEFSFPSCVRGYHIYKEVWRPNIGDELNCHKEPSLAA